MLRVTLELLPGGDERRARPLGTIEIVNIGGDEGCADYAVTERATERTATLRREPRGREWAIVMSAIRALFG